MDYTGTVTKVYVDVMLLTNFLMDLLILWAAGRLVNCTAKRWRLFLGTLLGAAYSLSVFFPEVKIIHSLPVKFGCSLVMILLAYYPLKLRTFLLTVLNFYLISFAMGGAVIAATYFLDDAPIFIQMIDKAGIFMGNMNFGMLALGLLVAMLIGWGGLTILRKRNLQLNYLRTLTISLQGHLLETTALLDTGNQLREPLTNCPVVVVEVALLRDKIPYCIQKAVEKGPLTAELTAGVEPEWIDRLRFIPFNSVGRNNGMMVGIRPDWAEITTPEGTVRLKNVFLGLIDKPLNKEGKYRALVPAGVLHEI